MTEKWKALREALEKIKAAEAEPGWVAKVDLPYMVSRGEYQSAANPFAIADLLAERDRLPQ